MMRFLSRVLPAFALLAFAAPAFAQSANLAITANVSASCRVTSAAPAITINYDVFSAPTAAGNFPVNVRCTRGTNISVAATAGGNPAAVAGFARAVAFGAEMIGYTLSLTAGGADLVPNAVTGSYPSAGKGTDVPISLFAVLDTGAAADPIPGAYTDTVVLTFTAL
jgi:spore coat protein U-like protein